MSKLSKVIGEFEENQEDQITVAASSAEDLLLLFDTIAAVAVKGAKEERYATIGADLARDLIDQLRELAGLGGTDNGPKLVTLTGGRL